MLLAEAQHRRLHSAFVWVRQNCLVLAISYTCEIEECQNVCQQEEAEAKPAGAEGTGEDWCDPNAYNKETASAVSLNSYIGHKLGP